METTIMGLYRFRVWGVKADEKGFCFVVWAKQRPLIQGKEGLVVTRPPPYQGKQTEGPMCHRLPARPVEAGSNPGAPRRSHVMIARPLVK